MNLSSGRVGVGVEGSNLYGNGQSGAGSGPFPPPPSARWFSPSTFLK